MEAVRFVRKIAEVVRIVTKETIELAKDTEQAKPKI